MHLIASQDTKVNRLIPSQINLLLTSLVWLSSLPATCQSSNKNNIIDEHGAIIRGDINKKEIALVFTGHEFADGSDVIVDVLKRNAIHAGFFLTGDFYLNSNFESLIKDLIRDGHYLGAHSDKHLLYADWDRRDNLLVTKEEFMHDLHDNYKRMARFGIKKSAASLFLPPFEWYNSTVSAWTQEMGLQLINFTPGTRSTADYTYPEMGNRYLASDKIYQSIVDCEAKDSNGLNGFILLIHFGTDPRRNDKFYNKLDQLINELKNKNYVFVRVDKLLK